MTISLLGRSTLLLSGTWVLLAAGAGAASASVITFSDPVASAGTTAGLQTTVQYYVPTFGSDTGANGGYVGGGGYSTYQGGMATGNPTLTTLSDMESFLNTGSFIVPAGDSNNGKATTYTTASETSSVTTVGNVLQSSNPDYPTYTLNNLTAGQPVAYNVDQQGYIDIATAGTYTFTLTNADDAAEVYIGGNGTAGSGTAIAAYGYSGTWGNSTAVDFTAAGLYNFELFYYQGYGGYGLTYTVTAPTGAAAPTYYAAVPEPASLGLCAAGALGLLMLRRRGSRQV